MSDLNGKSPVISEAIILAGGLGTRLRSAVPDLPKCMAPVAGKPFIAHVIDYFVGQGIDRFIFSLGYKHEVIENYLNTAYPLLRKVYSVEEEPLGTGGAIRLACRKALTADLLVLNGDTLFRVDVQGVYRYHLEKKSQCTLCLKPMQDFDRYGVVELDREGRVKDFREKQWYAKGNINGGVYILNLADFLRLPFPEKFSFEKDYLEKHDQEGRFFGELQEGYFIDIGIPADFEKAQHEL